MNAKKAKAARKLLRNLEKMDAGKTPIAENGYREREDRRKIQEMIVMEDDAPVKRQVQVSHGTMVVTPGSKRSRYLYIKKQIANLDKKQEI